MGSSGEKHGKEHDGRGGGEDRADLGGGEGDKLDESLVLADEMPLEESEAFPDADKRVWGRTWDTMSSGRSSGAPRDTPLLPSTEV